jgi:tRNA-2-methylthio-N6-dimethylallyladenosine synthase
MDPKRKVYIETYGCQMNVADSEVVLSIMGTAGYGRTDNLASADVVLVNTCAIRENAEERIYGRLGEFRRLKRERPDLLVGVLGCMAERLRKDLLASEGHVDLIVGPDEYRKLPDLLEGAREGERGIAVRLSRVENYDDIVPLRTDGLSAWISVMRGCDKFCTFCVVPFTRGRERSRTVDSIVQEAKLLAREGYKEITLLGQNVNSYRDGMHDFADLLARVAAIDRSIRLRFTTSHPKDMSEKLLRTIAHNDNICKYIHLPVQSGSDRILGLMNRGYTVGEYLDLVGRIRSLMPGVSLSTDIIAGFPTETEDDHRATLDLLEQVEYDGAFTFQYSARENTKAWEMGDSVPQEIKTRRLNEIIETQRKISLRRNRQMVGGVVDVLIEGESKKSSEDFCGRTDTNKTVILPRNGYRRGEIVQVRINRVNSATLFGSHFVPGDSLPEGVQEGGFVR